MHTLLQAYLPLDMRTKKTRAIRRRLTKEQVRSIQGWGLQLHIRQQASQEPAGQSILVWKGILVQRGNLEGARREQQECIESAPKLA